MHKLSHFFQYLILFLATLVTSCGFENVDNSIDAAEQSLANNDFAEASDICKTIARRDSLKNLTIGQLCRLSMVYMHLSENQDEDVNVAMATRCFHLAMEQDSVKAVSLYNDMPVDNQHWIHFLYEMNKVLDAPRDFFPEESNDTVFISGSPEIIDDVEMHHHHNH